MTWTNYANRGATLEKLVALVNMQYQKKGIAQIDKIATPIVPERVEKGKVYGHFSKKSTVDYAGLIKSGRFVCFDCKETNKTRFPLSDIQQHQIDYMRMVHNLNGLAFLVISFTKFKKYYRIDFSDLYNAWILYKNSKQKSERCANGTASIGVEDFKYEIVSESGICLHYLKGIVDW